MVAFGSRKDEYPGQIALRTVSCLSTKRTNFACHMNAGRSGVKAKTTTFKLRRSKMKREIKVALLTLIALAIFGWGFKYLQGQNLLKPSQIFYIRYDNVDYLKIASPVVISGLEVGTVKDIYQDPKDVRKIIVEITVEKRYCIPKNALARLVSTSLMGGKAIEISFDVGRSQEDCIASGSFIQGKTVGFLPSMAGEKVATSTEEVLEKLVHLLDSINGQMSSDDKKMLGQSMKDIQGALANLHAMSASLNAMIAQSRSSIQNTLSYTEEITGMLAAQRDAIAQTITHFNNISKDLEDSQLGSQISSLSDKLKTTLSSLDTGLQQFSSILNDLQKGKGSLGLLLQDESLYENLNTTLQHTELLLQDFRLHPKRYTRLLSKKEKPYVAPAEDPGLKEQRE